jgi:hypothetical protein
VDDLVLHAAEQFEAEAPGWFDACAAMKLVRRYEAAYKALPSLVGKYAWAATASWRTAATLFR